MAIQVAVTVIIVLVVVRIITVPVAIAVDEVASGERVSAARFEFLRRVWARGGVRLHTSFHTKSCPFAALVTACPKCMQGNWAGGYPEHGGATDSTSFCYGRVGCCLTNVGYSPELLLLLLLNALLVEPIPLLPILPSSLLTVVLLLLRLPEL